MNGNPPADSEPSDESTDETTDELTGETTDETSAETTDESTAVSATRREYLQTAVVAGAGFAAVGAVPDASESASYETITVGAGETHTIDLSDGDTYENKLIDITADDAAVFFDADGNDWTIRNVGVKGAQSKDRTFAHMSVPDSGSSGLVENFYIGDGTDVCPSDVTATWVDGTDDDAHRGTLTFRNVNVQGFSDNGLYGSGPGTNLGPDEGGEVIIEDSYAKNNNISSFRIGTNGSRIRNSVVHVTDGSDVCAYTGEDVNARGCWAREGATDLRIENCDIKVADYNAVQINENTSLTIADSRIEGTIDNRGNLTEDNVSSSPDTTPPDCVPQTPEEAASATSCDGSGGDISDSGTITFEGGSDSSDYRVGAGSSLTGQSNVDSEDAVYENATAKGSVTGGNDSFDYAGGITFCNVRGGDATVSVNGSQVDPDTLGELPNTVSIDSTDSEDPTSYLLSVSDQLEKSTHDGATIDPDDDIADGAATGTVQGGADGYRFSGELTSFDYSGGSFDLYVNGELTDPDSMESCSTVVDDFEDGDLSEYAFNTGSSGASVVSSPTHSGSYALEYADVGIEAISTAGLNAYPSAGDTFSYWVRVTGGAEEVNLTYGVQGHDNRYIIRFDNPQSDLYLYRYENATLNQLGGIDPSLSEDAWYEVEVQWAPDGTHTLTLRDSSGSQLGQFTATDSTWTAGGVGYDAYLDSGERVYFDDVTIE